MRRFFCVSLAILGSCAVMLAATLLAQASSLSRVGVWWTPREVSQSGDAASRGPDIVADGSGYLHLIWMDDKSGPADLYYVRSEDQGSIWSAEEYIDTASTSHQGAIAVDITRTVHACWWEFAAGEFNLLYAQRSAGGWSLKETAVLTDSDIQEPSIAEAGNYVHVVWSNKLQPDLDLFYSSRKLVNGSGWLTPTVIVDTDFSSLYARMAVDTNGNLHLVWQENTLPGNRIMYISATVNAGQTTWFSPISVSVGLDRGATFPDIAVGDDAVHTVFGVDVEGQPDTQDVYYARFPISGTQNISPTVIPGSRVAVNQMLPTDASPSIALNGPDEVHVAWNGMTGTDIWDRIYYAVSEDQGVSWSQPIGISPDDASPDVLPTLAMDGTLAHVAWQQKEQGDDNDIYYSHTGSAMSLLPLVLKDYS